jgi:NADH-quinone oxidoreductase subunit D
MRESLRIIHFCIENMPKGPILSDNYKIRPPSRNEIKNSMEAIIHHFKYFTEGFDVPKSKIYVGTEAPKGEFGVFFSFRWF